jgi:S-adenosylmethionine:tRNA ribosyltransferase-isomerase
VLVSDFDYELPPELIAQAPPETRGASRMLVVSRGEQRFYDDVFRNLPNYIRPGDCLVLNNTRVFPARLYGRRNRPSGAQVEVFLVRAMPGEPSKWRTLVRPGKRVRSGDRIEFGSGLSAEVKAAGEFGERELQFHATGSLEEAFERLGKTPLPPYIHREPDELDRERYQTIYAERSGSVAAPTAGLHFTEEIVAACVAAGAELARVTLHVGLGTFAPLRENDVSRVKLHEEYFEISEEAAAALSRAKRVLCVGTTSVRTVETARLSGAWRSLQGETNLFIYPGSFSFLATGALLTNFHLPQSSLLLLACAFGGKELILRAYRHAVSERYRFFSYGDCMLII